MDNSKFRQAALALAQAVTDDCKQYGYEELPPQIMVAYREFCDVAGLEQPPPRKGEPVKWTHDEWTR